MMASEHARMTHVAHVLVHRDARGMVRSKHVQPHTRTLVFLHARPAIVTTCDPRIRVHAPSMPCAYVLRTYRAVCAAGSALHASSLPCVPCVVCVLLPAGVQ